MKGRERILSILIKRKDLTKESMKKLEIKLALITSNYDF